MKSLMLMMLAAFPVLALAQPAHTGRAPATLQVDARATIARAPDRAYIDIGVRTEAKQSRRAAADNAARVAVVLTAVRKAAGPGAQLATTDYSIAPQYQYHSDGTPPTLTGYSVTNLVRVRLDDLRRIGAVIDAASGAGANVQQNLRFALRDPEATRLHALAQAATRARKAAHALATALGLRVVRILSVRQTGVSLARSRPLVYPQTLRAQRARIATPIESGRIRVTVNISLTVAVAPR